MGAIRRAVLPLLLLGGGLAATLSASHAAASADGESVTGGGHVAATNFQVSIHAGANGESPTGTLKTTGFYSFTATVTCLSLAGTTGVSGYRIDSGDHAGQGFLVSAHDGGPGAPDEVYYSGMLAAPPSSCPSPSAPPPAFTASGGGGTLDSGDLVVGGGPPETTPPWRPGPGVHGGPAPTMPPSPSPPGHTGAVLRVVPERALGPVRLGEPRRAAMRSLRARSRDLSVAFDRRGRVRLLSSSAPGVTLYGRRLNQGLARLAPTLRAHGWSVGRCAAFHRRGRSSRTRSTAVVVTGYGVSEVFLTVRGEGPVGCPLASRARSVHG